ncbi:PREDICTED: cytosolic phospholipase A2 gamma [Chrysochloris asiatica]|uniref:Cytosolic phospholipase A2 gamma n=1 Tax=Chrysochloris asiatica TaxID=185453 RepID=A0A9B0TVH4_CHRAS|nr:PREDICTED: cytosolic phospholipase A2 gamma [Chrysochloris asiatica]
MYSLCSSSCCPIITLIHGISCLFGFTLGSSEVFIIPGLQKEEEVTVKKRSLNVLKALKKLDVDTDKVPVIALLCSGGGLRAHIACVGVLSEMKRHSLLDAVTYLAGVSGSTWALSSFYANNGNMETIEAELKYRFDQKEWDLGKSLEKTIQAARLESYSLTDFWAYMVVSKQTRELQDSCLSSLAKDVEEGTLPYPIFAAIDDDLKTAWQKKKTQKTWFEFTPHHAGYPALGAYVPTNLFGSKFEKGKLVRSEPERDLSFLKGLWGSALARIEDIRALILAQLLSLKEKLKPKYLSESTAEGVGVMESLLELVVAHIKDYSASHVQEKLQALQRELDAESRDKDGGGKHTWLSEMVQNWGKISEEERGQFIEYLVHCFSRQGWWTSNSDTRVFLDLFKDFVNFLNKTGICWWKWEWGTTHNFLYKHGDIRDKVMNGREVLHLIDAGLAINTSYPLVLPPIREADLILSFDFSAGDPFETIRATADYCRRHDIPFPPVKEADLQEWSRSPSDCYIFKGETGPVVMHFPLFNTEACGDDIQSWIDSYGTIKLADSYTQEVVTQLLELSKKNVSHNKDIILREMRNLAREPRKFVVVSKKKLLEDMVEEHMEVSRAVGIKITNNTDVTFKDPLFYCHSDHTQAPPAMLPPKSTISCSFVKKTSSAFQGNVGLLVYQGPEVHLALLFSTPFNYALHTIEFALAVLTGPITSDQLERVFNNIIQEKESPEMKVVKCALRVPQQTLDLEHDSLTIRAIVSNVQMAKMNVVVEAKAT